MDYFKEKTVESDLITKIREQKDEIERQKRELDQSLTYASSIQSALLPDPAYLKRILPQSFVLFKPRDIVSGDFYWVGQKQGIIAVAAADCTGHGVPGAFMSMLGISFLNDIVGKCIPNPNTILNRLREMVMKTLHQTGEHSEHKDGMDISLCVIDYKESMLQYSGALNPLYLFRNGELIEIKGDRMPIGIAGIEEKSFTNNRIPLKKEDIFYIFSDGFPDQFGGPNERKYRYKQFKQLLFRIHKKDMHIQRRLLENEFNRWKGDLEQIDDVVVLGIRI